MGTWSTVWHSLDEAFFMFWQTLWALVLGFALSGAVQALVSRRAMVRTMGDHRPASITRAALFGMASSSCSYAASALARSLFTRGADFTTSIVFMIASTNLVIELGLVMWLLLGFAVHHVYSSVLMAFVEKTGTMDSIFTGYKSVPKRELDEGPYRWRHRGELDE